MKIYIDQLIIEVTRKCNFACQHCLRGDAENISIDLRYVENLFKRVDSIGKLTFTGGEPQLAVAEIAQILHLAKHYNVDVDNFYVATNGAINSKEFVLLMMEWYMYCSNSDDSLIDLSLDYYHQLEKNVDIDSLWISKLKFFKTRDEDLKLDDDFRSEGRWFGNSKYGTNPDSIYIENYYEDSNSVSIYGSFYLNAKGYIIRGCDFSYENQENYIHGNIIDSWVMLHESTGNIVPIDEWINTQIEEIGAFNE